MESPKDIFEEKVRYQISAYFENKGIKKCADKSILIKAIVFLLLFILSYVVILNYTETTTLLLSYAALGLSCMLLSINIGHEAIHNCLSFKKRLNYLGRLTFNLAGISYSIWGSKHLNSHHKHTNIPELDTDLRQSRLVRLDQNFPKSKFHPFQPYYMPLLYLFYTFHWTYIRDFREMITLNSKETSVKKVKLLSSLLIIKSSHLIIFLIIPLLVHNNSNIFYGFFLSYISTGAFFGLFLIPIHINEHAIIQSKGLKNRLGFVEQLESTPNFSTTNKVLNFLLGGFNRHACHHLFPSISHIHYHHINRIIQKVSQEEGIRYNDLTYVELIKSHFRYLKNLSK